MATAAVATMAIMLGVDSLRIVATIGAVRIGLAAGAVLEVMRSGRGMGWGGVSSRPQPRKGVVEAGDEVGTLGLSERGPDLGLRRLPSRPCRLERGEPPGRQ